jgi:hypothetical protein
MNKEKIIVKEPKSESGKTFNTNDGSSFSEDGFGTVFVSVGKSKVGFTHAAERVKLYGQIGFASRIFGGVGTWATREANAANMSGLRLNLGINEMVSHIKVINAGVFFDEGLRPLPDAISDKGQNEANKVDKYSNVLSYIVASKEDEMDDMIRSVNRFVK